MERFWSKVDKTGDCWTWTASRTAGGYGRFSVSANRYVMAHRWAYEQVHGPIPAGLRLDHLCRTPGCVRPEHLEAVTHAENVRRGNGGRPPGPGARKSGRLRNPDGTFVACPQDHPLSGANLYVDPRGNRHCRRCQVIRKSEKVSAT